MRIGKHLPLAGRRPIANEPGRYVAPMINGVLARCRFGRATS
jgi:hypothetical protein